MIKFDPNAWTERDIELLTIPVIPALKLRAKDGELDILDTIDKINWEDDIWDLRTIYYFLYTGLNRNWDAKEKVEERLTKIIDEPFKDFLRKMDIIYHHKREEGY